MTVLLLLGILPIAYVYVIRSADIIHDVAATGVTIFDYVPITATYNESMALTYINGTVENQGTVSETFNVSIYYRLAGQDEILTLETVTLTPGSSAVVTAVLNITDLVTNYGNSTHPILRVPVGYLTIIVEASEVANETDTSDNTFITQLLIKMPGDIIDKQKSYNGDGCVDRYDYGELAMRYATCFVHDPKFHDQCDLDRDGIVGRYDYGKLAWYYGTCTVYQVL